MYSLSLEIREYITELLHLSDAFSLSLTCWDLHNVDRRLLYLRSLKNKQSLQLPLSIIVETVCAVLYKCIDATHRDKIKSTEAVIRDVTATYNSYPNGYFALGQRTHGVGIIGPKGPIGFKGPTGVKGWIGNPIFSYPMSKEEKNQMIRKQYEKLIQEHIIRNKEIFEVIIRKDYEIACYIALSLGNRLSGIIVYDDPLLFRLTEPSLFNGMEDDSISDEVCTERIKIFREIIDNDAVRILCTLEFRYISRSWIYYIANRGSQAILKELRKTSEIRELLN